MFRYFRVNVLDELLNERRLARLFSTEARDCALQLWILQIKSGQSIENRVIYGRLLPYSHSSGRWSASDDDDLEAFGQDLAQVAQFNLKIKSVYCAALLRGTERRPYSHPIVEDDAPDRFASMRPGTAEYNTLNYGGDLDLINGVSG